MKKIFKNWLKENYIGIIIVAVIIFAMFYFTIPEPHFKIYKGIEMEEVDEMKNIQIEVPEGYSGFKDCECLKEYDFHKIYNISEDIPILGTGCEVIGTCYIIQTISKSDLSIEWLNENCDCLNYFSQGKIIEGCNKAKTTSPDCFDCQLYQCREYLVEVWYQIK